MAQVPAPGALDPGPATPVTVKACLGTLRGPPQALPKSDQTPSGVFVLTIVAYRVHPETQKLARARAPSGFDIGPSPAGQNKKFLFAGRSFLQRSSLV